MPAEPFAKRAIAHSDAALVEFLLSSGVTVDDQALKTAIQESRPDAVRLLILAGADINTRDSHGDPILNVLLRKSMPNYRESRVQWNLS
jgi:ankyrin repeat protein